MNFEFEQHTSEESLESYALGRLDEANTELLEQHLLICDQCRVRLDEADKYVNAMQLAAARLRRAQSHGKSESAASGSILDFLRAGSKWNAVGLAAIAMALFVITLAMPHLSSIGAPDRTAGLAMNNTPVPVTLVADRGDVITAPANHILDLKMDARGLDLGPHARVDVVNARGRIIETVSSAEVAEKIAIRTTHRLEAGYYYVRIYASDNSASGTLEMVREFGLDLK